MASKREVIEIPGLSHMVPIPMGAKKGNIVFSSAIGGRNPETGETPKVHRSSGRDALSQCAHVHEECWGNDR